MNYWDATAGKYQQVTRISCDEFHYGPLLPGDTFFQLLPAELKGMKCLEAGCGAAQNSIYLSKHGATCTAFDYSEKQLSEAKHLCEKHCVSVELICANLNNFTDSVSGKFDLVHSSYALPFAENEEKIIGELASLLVPGGTLIVSTSHPLYFCEWIELEDAAQGVFVENYHREVFDDRTLDVDSTIACFAKAVPPSRIFACLRKAGLTVTDFLEPEPVDIDGMSEEQIRKSVPYESSDWRDCRNEVSKIPFITIFKATSPS